METSYTNQNLNQETDKRVISELLAEESSTPEKLIDIPSKPKKQTYKKNSPKYKEFCHLFCTKFAETLGEISNMTYNDVQQLFEKKIKKICIGGSQSYYDPATKVVNLSYNIDHCFIHEALHGISAMNKRRNIFRTGFGLNTSDFNFEEGMTDFYTCCMLKKENKITSTYTPIAAYQIYATAISLLNKLSDPKQMINFYLNNDKTFIKHLNTLDHNAYSKTKKILNSIPRQISYRGFDKRNLEALDYFYRLIKAKKLTPVSTIDDFKNNVDALLEIYEQELIILSEEIYINNGKLKNIDNPDVRTRFANDFIKRLGNQFFDVFKNIVHDQWTPLNIDNEALFSQIIMDKISEKYPYVYPAIAYSNVFSNSINKDSENKLTTPSLTNSIEQPTKTNEQTISFENTQYNYNDFDSEYSNKGRSR